MYKCKYCNEEFDNKYKLTGHAVHCKLNPDKTKLFISLQYKYTGTVEGFETYVNYVDSNNKVTAAGVVSPNTSDCRER